MQNESTVLEEPRLAKLLFADTRLAWLWLPLRLFLGWEWLEAGWHKFTDPAWIQTGEALMKYWQRGLQLKPKPVIAVDWYRDFIQFLLDTGSYTWFSKLVIFGELAIGIALILGAFTGIAAFMGGFMNWNFIMAGSASTNGLLFAISTWLVLAWRTAGWIGLDRWLLPLLGTPWKPGRLFRVNREATVT
ncbi:MAG TPA: DoxX family protein [Candidatus Binatia bacterium]|jgi:thiosulfate dehydrogenase [quinone] large subunit|nr:DoxX family protein [Candidatus Binatia bacterium]